MPSFGNIVSQVLPLLVSMVLGTVIGWERQTDRKPAGLRTHTLVCLGSTLFILTARDASHVFGNQPDPTRIIHGVVTGVGFLGAGSILRQEGLIIGLTTAASIWMVAAIGVAIGIESYTLAVASTVMTLVILRGYRHIDAWLANGHGTKE